LGNYVWDKRRNAAEGIVARRVIGRNVVLPQQLHNDRLQAQNSGIEKPRHRLGRAGQTGRALRLGVPDKLLALADEVID
jgi:hypothetical protein